MRISTSIQTIPETLIYEMVEGKPIYYKGYRDILKGKKTTMSSYFQGFFVT